jgi:hypothetical protein
VEIDNAILSHTVWKERQRQSVESGELSFPVEVIAADNLCAFGKWLYGPSLSPEDKRSPAYAEIKRLHTEFHLMAAQVARHVESGNLSEARKLLRPGEDYEQTSTRLTSALIGWREALRPQALAR